ncbi:MAG: TRAP transporter small permease [Oscillibacter sp.]|nr:TRAP transporter small permease [Oscillibacter sp.]
MQKVFDAIFKALELFCAIVLFAITAACFYNIIARYIFGSSNAGIDELSRLAFCWSVCLGSALAFRAGAHLGVTALTKNFKGAAKKTYDILLNVALTVFMGTVLVAGFQLVKMGSMQYSEYLRMSMVYFYASIPVGAVFSILTFIENIYQILTGTQDNNEEVQA